MENLTLHKMRISILWLIALAAFFGYVIIAGDEVPANLSNLSLISNQELASVSIVIMIFAFLSVTLKGSLNRLANIIAGVIIGIGSIVAFFDGVTVNLYGIYNVMMGVVFISMVLVILFAYKMPKLSA